MRKNIFDLIDKELDFRNEYVRLYDLIRVQKLVVFNDYKYTYIDIFDKYISEWEYRGICTTFDEIAENIGITDFPNMSAEESCLYLCELILNMRKFLLYIKNKIEPPEDAYYYGMYNEEDYDYLYLNDKILVDNINYIIQKLGYEIKDIDNKVILIKTNADVISTALIVEDDISNLILNYNDFKIAKDIKAKKGILLSLGQYIEPMRKDIKGKNSSLEDYIFLCLNKLNIRHNNKSGKEKNEYVKKMTDEELINWYDKLYDLILIAIRLIELPNTLNDFKALKKNIIESAEKEKV